MGLSVGLTFHIDQGCNGTIPKYGNRIMEQLVTQQAGRRGIRLLRVLRTETVNFKINDVSQFSVISNGAIAELLESLYMRNFNPD